MREDMAGPQVKVGTLHRGLGAREGARTAKQKLGRCGVLERCGDLHSDKRDGRQRSNCLPG
jgi:hypothetical protein